MQAPFLLESEQHIHYDQPRENMENSPTVNDTTNHSIYDWVSNVVSSTLDPIRLNKEFRNIMNSNRAMVFTGESTKTYSRLKKPLESEVCHLDPLSFPMVRFAPST